jgi:hypothetical protein
MLKIVESAPQLLISRLGAGMRQGAGLLVASKVQIGSIFTNPWRFSTLAELCSEHFESKKMRESFLTALLNEVEGLASSHMTSAAKDSALLVQRTELLLGLFVSLPYRNEFELAHILRHASRFLTLRTIPLLPDTDVSADDSVAAGQCDVFGIICASVLLHSLCQLLCSSSEMQRLLTADANGDADKPLSPGFARRLAPDESLQPLLRQLVDSAEDTEALIEILAQNVPVDSPLLRGHGVRKAAEKVSRRRKFAQAADKGHMKSPTESSAPAKKARRLSTAGDMDEALARCGA